MQSHRASPRSGQRYRRRLHSISRRHQSLHSLAQQLAVMAAASGTAFIGEQGTNIWIGDRGAIWLKQGTYRNPAASMQGFDSEQRTYIGPQGGLWLRIGWWTDVIRTPSWLRIREEEPVLPPPGPTAIPPPGIPPSHMATPFAMLPRIPMPHGGMWRASASGRLARPATPRAAPY